VFSSMHAQILNLPSTMRELSPQLRTKADVSPMPLLCNTKKLRSTLQTEQRDKAALNESHTVKGKAHIGDGSGSYWRWQWLILASRSRQE
jgi:hypothetical protein